MGPIRLLFLSDTHLGFDLPERPRVERRRRGDDFFANTRAALDRALAGDVDLVVHGGDLLYRSRVPIGLAERAFAELRRVADEGVPIVVVPGNHERSRIPYPLLLRHPNIHVFDDARSFSFDLRGVRVQIAGFPYLRDVRRSFTKSIERTALGRGPADVRLLCMHHCFEGATVGPVDFTFRDGSDVVRASDLPHGVAAVLSGHIHRHQVLERDLSGRPLRAPVVYPGSIERTSIAERFETKGYMLLDFLPNEFGGHLKRWELVPLPARPMIVCSIRANAKPAVLDRQVRTAIDRAPSDAIVMFRLDGDSSHARELLRAERLRAIAPSTMNVSVSTPGYLRSTQGSDAVTSFPATSRISRVQRSAAG